ncbi:hypothetical protein Pint_16922 [Pistacia integerrima]|uniref:Uncharacterized protein n=1 Tax=Pistacia integerrima TaxID=434235 RepID=A0ACC0ZCQ6_9ROSI|nr:hypothetical protein Pint_16922 [Pistacia integerrima]
MLDPATDLLPPTASPTISSVSSSDLDTESTGSFFHDRSTTLGTLMGVTFPAITFRAPSQHRDIHVNAAVATVPAVAARKKKRAVTNISASAVARRRWWRLCGDGDAKPASLGEFLEVERRFGDTAFYSAAAELESVVASESGGRNGNNGRVLFADGRVLPPAANDDADDTSSTSGILCRFPVSITGICR